jgi:hypothetical protein
LSRRARERNCASRTEAHQAEVKKKKTEEDEEPGSPGERLAALSLSESPGPSDGDYVPEQPIGDSDADFEAPENRSKLTYVTTRRAWAQHVAESTKLSKKAATGEKPGQRPRKK